MNDGGSDFTEEIKKVLDSTTKKIEKMNESFVEREKVLEAKLKKAMKDSVDKNGKKITKLEDTLSKFTKGMSDMPGRFTDLEVRIEQIAQMRVVAGPSDPSQNHLASAASVASKKSSIASATAIKENGFMP